MSTQKHGSLLQTEFCLLQTYRKVVFNSLCPHGLYSPWNSPGQNTGVGSLSLLHGIFPTQGSNPGLLHCRRILHQLSHKLIVWYVNCLLVNLEREGRGGTMSHSSRIPWNLKSRKTMQLRLSTSNLNSGT